MTTTTSKNTKRPPALIKSFQLKTKAFEHWSTAKQQITSTAKMKVLSKNNIKVVPNNKFFVSDNQPSPTRRNSRSTSPLDTTRTLRKLYKAPNWRFCWVLLLFTWQSSKFATQQWPFQGLPSTILNWQIFQTLTVECAVIQDGPAGTKDPPLTINFELEV